MKTLVHLMLLYLEYSLAVLVVGVAIVVGRWLWLGLASFARQVRLTR